MQKFEKAPESTVVFSADVAVGVRSSVPGSEPRLMQCLAGKRWWGDGPLETGVEGSSTDLTRRIK